MINRFSIVMGEIERDLGTKDLNLLILGALKSSFKGYKGENIQSLITQMKEIIHVINSTEPRYSIVIYNLYNLFKKLLTIEEEKGGDYPYQQIKKRIINYIDKLIKEAEEQKKQLLKNAGGINVNGKTILIHDHSHTVHDVLQRLKKDGQKFKVIIAEQDMDKTLSNIETLTKKKIPFQVVPDHMLSNIEDEIDVCFFGALTLKSTYDFVVDTGTNAVISEFHLQKKPIYFFLSTSKFSLWKARKKETVKKITHTRKHPSKQLHFERFKFSHDRVSLSQVDYTVTEKGIFDAHGLKKLYKDKFDEHVSFTKEIEAM